MKSFLAKTFLHLAAMLLAGLGFILIFLAITRLVSVQKPIKIVDNAILVFDLNSSINDSPQSVDVLQTLTDHVSGLSHQSIHLKGVIDAIDRAAADERISGIYLQGSLIPANNASGFASLSEIREALLRFRKVGKSVTAYLVQPTLRDYYLSSVADTVILNPFGHLDFKGLVAKRAFLAKALDQYGIEVQTLKAGEYKSAVEMFTREGMSLKDREQTTAMIDTLWQSLVEGVAQGRGIAESALYEIAEQHGILTAQQAYDLKLVDKIDYFDAVLNDLTSRTGFSEDSQSFSQVALLDYAYQGHSGAWPKSGPVIAVVYIEGDIVDGEGGHQLIGGDALARELRALRLDDSVRSLVLRINTQGGSAVASELIEREVGLIRAAGKPVVVSMGSVAASGGYWIASGADRIFAEPTTITGSIGVFGLIPNLENLTTKIGITFDAVKTNTYADIGSMDRSQSEDELALMQGFVDRLYAVFIEKVAKGRKLDPEYVETIASGRVWTGKDALRLGLVDEAGGLNDAIEQARVLAGLGADAAVVEFPEVHPTDFWELLLTQSFRPAPVAQWSRLPKDLNALRKAYHWLNSFNAPHHTYARMPFILNLE